MTFWYFLIAGVFVLRSYFHRLLDTYSYVQWFFHSRYFQLLFILCSCGYSSTDWGGSTVMMLSNSTTRRWAEHCNGVNKGVLHTADEVNVVFLVNLLFGNYCWWRLYKTKCSCCDKVTKHTSLNLITSNKSLIRKMKTWCQWHIMADST